MPLVLRPSRLFLACAIGCAAGALDAGCFSDDSGGKATVDAGPAYDASLPPSEGGPGAQDAAAPDAAVQDAPQAVDAPPESTPDDGSADALLDTAAGDDGGAGGTIGTSLSGITYGAASSDGSAMIVVGTGAVWWSHYEPASGWSTAAQLPDTVKSAASMQLAMDGMGNAFLVWPFNAAEAGATAHWTYGVIRYDHPTNSWGAPQYPDTTGKALWQYPALSVNASGDVLLIDPPDPSWSPGAAPLYAEHYSGGMWTQETVVAMPDTYTFPTVYMNDAGLAVATILSGSTGTAAAVTRSAAGVWTKAAGAIDPIAQGGGAGPSATINAGGDVLVGWLAGGSSAHPVAYQYDASKQMWIGPAPLSAENETALGSCPVGVALTPGGDGVLTRCYYGPMGLSTPALEAYAFTKSTGTWSAMPQNANITGMPDVRSVAFDTSGAGFAALVDKGGAGTSMGGVHAVPYAPGTGWGTESAAENPDAGATSVSSLIAFVSPSGATGFVSWSDGSNTFVAKVR
jgi:hypothetical protein